MQRELNLDETARRTPENEAALLERKIASSFVQGSGAIEWLWNTNSDMTESNETPIGAVRPDGTEKPEATVLRAMPVSPGAESAPAQSRAACNRHHHIASRSVFCNRDLQLAAQRNAVRALTYYDHFTAYAVAENQLGKTGYAKAGDSPSAQALTDTAWRLLLKYANDGGNLLITGPVEKDEHWHRAARAAERRWTLRSEPLTYHNAEIVERRAFLSPSTSRAKAGWIHSDSTTDLPSKWSLMVRAGSSGRRIRWNWPMDAIDRRSLRLCGRPRWRGSDVRPVGATFPRRPRLPHRAGGLRGLRNDFRRRGGREDRFARQNDRRPVDSAASVAARRHRGDRQEGKDSGCQVRLLNAREEPVSVAPLINCA